MAGARGQPYAPLGILYLAAYLRQFGLQVGIFDATFANGLSDFINALQQNKPRVVGIQGLITTRNISKLMIQAAKNLGAVVIMGGPDPSSSWEDYLQWGADYVVIGEGELPLHKLMLYLTKQSGKSDDINFGDIPGLAYTKNGQIHLTSGYRKNANLDSLPLPAYDLINVEKYLDAWRSYNGYASMHLLTSRGCPFGCEWCSHAVFGRTFRQRSVENVIKEMHFLYDTYRPDHLTIGDDTFGLNARWLSDWCDAFKDAGFKFRFRCFSRADVVNEQMLLKLKEVGCSHIHLGVESGSQRILDSMNKGTRVEDIYRVSDLIKKAGIGLGYFIMLAYPGETYKDIHKTEKLILEIKPDTLGLSIAYPVPGTLFYERVRGDILPLVNNNGEEQMGSGYQLKFRATYPALYYRHLLGYIQRRYRLYTKTGSRLERLSANLLAVLDFIFLRMFERLWLLF
jgi:radical SAM superfamily enzyme YgiQ (UPF0313 family)